MRLSHLEHLAALYRPDKQMEALMSGWEHDRMRFERTVPSRLRICLGRLSRLAVALSLATLLIGCGLPADQDESKPVPPVIVTPEPRTPLPAAPTSEPVDVNALPESARRAIASPEPTR